MLFIPSGPKKKKKKAEGNANNRTWKHENIKSLAKHFMRKPKEQTKLTLVFGDVSCTSLSTSLVKRKGKEFLQLASYKTSIKETLETKEYYLSQKLQYSEK